MKNVFSFNTDGEVDMMNILTFLTLSEQIQQTTLGNNAF